MDVSATDAVLEFLASNPGANMGEVRAHLTELGHDVGAPGEVGKLLAELAHQERVVQRNGNRNARLNYLPDDAVRALARARRSPLGAGDPARPTSQPVSP